MTKTLQERTEKFLQDAINLTKTYQTLRGLQRKLERSREQLHQPMRVAIVGKIKAGKSTTINALLGESVVATGAVEKTFNINWLKYGTERSLVVHFKDDRPPETKSFEELEVLTSRAEDDFDFLCSIEYVEVFYPSIMLQSLNLIDTPGLSSFYQDDSDNTRKFLQLRGEELSAITYKQASQADAVLYLFQQSIHDRDEQVMQEFQGPVVGRSTPMNAIGVLTRVDSNWPSESDPMAAGRRVVQRLMNDHHQLRCLFYKIHPISGLLALGSQSLTEEDFTLLSQLAALPAERFRSLISDATRFNTREYLQEPHIPSAAVRKQLSDRLGRYGIQLAYQSIRSGINNREQVAQLLLQQSGVLELRELILSHFGKRAFLIKLNTCLQHLKRVLFYEDQKQIGIERQIVREISGSIDKLESDEFFFHEIRTLEVLRNHYEKKLNLSDDEIEQLLQVTGERGTSCGERLGLTKQAIISEMRDRARQRIEYWLKVANDFGNSAEVVKAANIIVQSYERLAYHVDKARKHLDLDGHEMQDRKQLADELLQCSFAPELLELGNKLQRAIGSSANNHTFLTEFNTILQQIKKICFLQQHQDSSELKLLDTIAAKVDRIEANEHGLRELKILYSYEQGKLDFDANEAQQLLEVTGKYGTTCSERLGLSKQVGIEEMLDRAKERKLYWLERASDPFGTNSQTLGAINVLVQSYERIQYYIEEARKHLYF